MEFKIGGRNNGQSLYNASKLLDYINKLPEDKMYGILKAKGITIMTKDEVISKNKVENIIQTEIEKLKILAEKSDDETLQYCELDIRKNQIYLLKAILNKLNEEEN